MIKNGTVQIDNEISDADLIKFFGPALAPVETVLPSQTAKVSTPSGKLKLRDGNEYAIADINANLLEKIGYTPKEIGKLLKAIC